VTFYHKNTKDVQYADVWTAQHAGCGMQRAEDDWLRRHGRRKAHESEPGWDGSPDELPSFYHEDTFEHSAYHAGCIDLDSPWYDVLLSKQAEQNRQAFHKNGDAGCLPTMRKAMLAAKSFAALRHL
jgi:hypothetical protein